MTWINPTTLNFPDPEKSPYPDVVALGGDLSPERLLAAYKLGIFPWYNEGEPILWWSPDPRMVLFPNDLKIAKSMRPLFNQQKFRVTYNQAFRRVMENCRDRERKDQDGTWINDEMVDAYSILNQHGYAHSVEVWDGEALVGGLYGMAIGKLFFGESMFTHISNASKYGFISLVQELKKRNFQLIDCQQETVHLTSLGGKMISRKEFMRYVKANSGERLLLDSF
jgi:leucyl/phenylalanyl-tRNA---protein transferase